MAHASTLAVQHPRVVACCSTHLCVAHARSLGPSSSPLQHRSLQYLSVNMPARSIITLLAIFASVLVLATCCDPEDTYNGCKISGTSCSCGYGCNTEYIYRTRRACMNALKERSTNICYQQPCRRGNCIQTMQDPGFTCKCHGTGFYGQRCEIACPTMPIRGVYPHECVVI